MNQFETFRALRRSLSLSLDHMSEAMVQASCGNDANAKHWLEMLQDNLSGASMDVASLIMQLKNPDQGQDKTCPE